MKLLILGDLFPKTIKQYPRFEGYDFRMANLECAISDDDKPIVKDGPSLKIPSERINILKDLKLDLVGLANNHVLDYGISGLNNTIKILEENNINYSGCTYCKNYFIKRIQNMNVAFYFVSEHQYNFFEDSGVGVNVLEEKTFCEIEELKKEVDFLIVLFHGGRELFRYPTPLLEKNCHRFVDCGASIVVCQHSHCVGCSEKYKDATIIYGQGNFIFPFSNVEHYKTGVSIEVDINDDGNYKIKYLPTVHLEDNVVRFANPQEAETILKGFNERTDNLANKGVDYIYDVFVQEKGMDFLYHLFNKSKFYIRLDTSRYFNGKLMKRYLKKNQRYLTYLYNYFNCETHVEFIKATLKKQIKDKDSE